MNEKENEGSRSVDVRVDSGTRYSVQQTRLRLAKTENNASQIFFLRSIYIYIDIYSHRHTNIPTKSARPSFRDDPRLTRGYKTLTGSVSVLRDFSGLKRSRAYYTTIFRPGYSTIIGLVILIEIIDKRRDSLKEWLLEL